MSHDLREQATRTHILSLTYKPKIEAVKAGTCRQTVRLKRSSVEKREGDKLILHTWAGLPYRSKWDWRLNIKISEIEKLLYESGKWHIWIPRACGYVLMSDSSLDEIAQRDGISPPTRQGLESTLKALNGLDSLEGTEWGVIRW